MNMTIYVPVKDGVAVRGAVATAEMARSLAGSAPQGERVKRADVIAVVVELPEGVTVASQEESA